jgi:hypothetical protein
MSTVYRGTPEYFRVFSELVKAAEYRGTTTYPQIAFPMGAHLQGNQMGNATGLILGEISTDEVKAGRPMPSVVAVGISGAPGEGFFGLAEKLGRLKPGHDRDAFCASEREAVYAEWSRKVNLAKYRRKPSS